MELSDCSFYREKKRIRKDAGTFVNQLFFAGADAAAFYLDKDINVRDREQS